MNSSVVIYGESHKLFGRGKDITYVFTDHYVAVVQFICAQDECEQLPHGPNPGSTYSWLRWTE